MDHNWNLKALEFNYNDGKTCSDYTFYTTPFYVHYNVFDKKKYSKNCNIVYITKSMQSWIFSSKMIIPVFRVTWSSEIILKICCSRRNTYFFFKVQKSNIEIKLNFETDFFVTTVIIVNYQLKNKYYLK